VFDPTYISGGVFPSEVTYLISAALVVAVITLLLAGRRDDDRAGVGPTARYLAAIGIVTLFVTLFASFAAVQALTDLVVDHQARFDEYSALYSEDASLEGGEIFLPVGYTIYDFGNDPTNNGNYSAAVASGLIAITTGLVFGFHARFRKRFMASRDGASGPAGRIDRTYHAGRCFIAALIVAVALTSVGFGVFEVIAPGIATGLSAKVTRAEGISEILSFGVLALAAGLIFIRSWRRVAPAGGA
jgi:hypothetical protein